MLDPPSDPVQRFYATHDESVRLGYGEGRVELLRTQQLLRAAMPPAPARILDVGGADGAHASWLREAGHEVEIVDVVALHIDRARARGFHAEVGDARALGHEDAGFDVVLLLGPLYHLRDHGERLAALFEARRVLRPGGLLAAAAVSRAAVLLDWLRQGTLAEPERWAVVKRIVAVGHDDTGVGEGAFYFHTVAELEHEVREAGFGKVEVRGVEGPAWPLLDRTTPPDDPLIAQVIEVAQLTDGDDTMVGASAHLLCLAQA